MDEKAQQQKLWTPVQAYTLWAICILLGIAIGYLFHSPVSATASADVPTSPRETGLATGQVTPQQLKHMADKKAEPLLAQLKDDPNNTNLLLNIGNVYLAAQQFDDARQYYEREVAVKPDALGFTQLASAYYYLGDVDKGITALHRALEVNPAFPNALYDLGVLEWRGKSDAKAAVAAWEKFLKVSPNDPHRAQVEKMTALAKKHSAIPAGTKTDKPAD
jgi:cytochrome c-type biogenesis protein CcmH/NrfG